MEHRKDEKWKSMLQWNILAALNGVATIVTLSTGGNATITAVVMVGAFILARLEEIEAKMDVLLEEKVEE